MFQKIESILICVQDVAEVANFYSDVFGLKLLWRNEQEDSAGLLFPDTGIEVILSYDPHRRGLTEIHYLVDDVISAIQKYAEQGCVVVIQPFDTHLGKCAVIKDPFGIQFFILDKTNALVELEMI
jgi:predicted enzyme related to lactoylglutathione lyase